MHPLGEFDKFLDHKIVSCENGKSEVILSVRDELKQRLGLFHGGVIAAFADFCMGSALYSADNKQIVTVEMSISYLKGVREGNIRGFGEIKKVGSKLCFTECQIFNKSSELVSTASAVYLRLSNPLY
jgi:uncharacterized protein (TIGR00369 family)